jgi:hypothetical protein
MKKNNNKNPIYRQGDVLLVRVDKIPDSLIKHKKNIATLAYGEVTGHSHTVEAEAYSTNGLDLADYIAVKNLIAEVVHQEHDTIKIEPGNYRVVRQVQYQRGQLRKVAD